MPDEPWNTTRFLDAVNAGAENACSHSVGCPYSELHSLAAELIQAEREARPFSPRATRRIVQRYTWWSK
jgi:hypothetical protein